MKTSVDSIFESGQRLKNCPFCGGEAEIRKVKHISEGWDYTPRCKIPSCPGRLTKKWMTEATALYAWNRRKESE